MFDSIEGELQQDEATRIVLRVPMGSGALSYELRSPVGTGVRLPATGTSSPSAKPILRCWVATCAVDDLPRLFGFASPEERELFGLLRKVSGVGPSLALALLSADRPENLLQAIHGGDAKYLQRIKGVGKKTAERICLEIQDQAGKWLSTLGAPTRAQQAPDPARDDAIAALIALGYDEPDARGRVERNRSKQPSATVEELIRAALSS